MEITDPLVLYANVRRSLVLAEPVLWSNPAALQKAGNSEEHSLLCLFAAVFFGKRPFPPEGHLNLYSFFLTEKNVFL